MIRKFVWAAVLGAAAAAACGQVPVSANHIVDSLLRPIGPARLCFASVDAAQVPVGFRMGATQVVPGEACVAVTKGVMEAGHAVAPSPAGLFYHVYVKTQFTNSIIKDYGFTPITGSSWTLDTYDPSVMITYLGSPGGSITLTTSGNNCAAPTYADGVLNIPPCTLVGGTTDWSTLTGKPTFATVATSGSYLDLLSRPSLATVASSGSYTDLLNKPVIPAAQVQSDWGASAGVSAIMNKPTFATVATSGSYTDLLNKPTFQAPISLTTTGDNCATPTFAGGVLNIPVCAPSGGTTDWTSITGKPTFATVATTGSYADLLNKPTIPAAQVQSDWNALSGAAVILNKPNLAGVALSGSYTDLSNKPTLGTAAAQNTAAFDAAGAAATAQTAAANAQGTANAALPANGCTSTGGNLTCPGAGTFKSLVVPADGTHSQSQVFSPNTISWPIGANQTGMEAPLVASLTSAYWDLPSVNCSGNCVWVFGAATGSPLHHINTPVAVDAASLSAGRPEMVLLFSNVCAVQFACTYFPQWTNVRAITINSWGYTTNGPLTGCTTLPVVSLKQGSTVLGTITLANGGTGNYTATGFPVNVAANAGTITVSLNQAAAGCSAFGSTAYSWIDYQMQ